jgi:hypothetical protein
VDSLCHPGFTTTKLSHRFPIFETSATALCGTTGIYGEHVFFGCALQIQGYFRKVVLDIVDEVLLESMGWLV